jgi:tetratricopeptide (TPR) repeat protein
MIAGAIVAAALVAGGVYYALNRPEGDATPPVTIAEAPPTMAPATLAPETLPPATMAATPPPTAAPPPTFADATGRAAASMRAAQRAFRLNDYDGAMAHAQKALTEEPGHAEARRLADDALKGQRALARFAAAEAAVRDGNFAQALSEADAGRGLAPWDPRGPQLVTRIQQAQADAQRAAQQREARERQAQAASQVNALLVQAEAALSGQKYDAAIAFYDEALKLDAGNSRATSGRATAFQARVLAQAASSGGGRVASVRKFVSARTAATSRETAAASDTPAGFEDSPEVTVRRGTQAAELPGKVNFDIDPDLVKAGDRYTVKVYLLNEGNAPIQIRDMIVTTKINGKGVSGPVPPQTQNVAPQQRALLMSTTELWKEETASWSMEVAVRTARGERYTNQVEWK